MRVNIYSQELITDVIYTGPIVDVVEKISNTGLVYTAVLMYLHSSERLHHPPKDDDRSAIAIWLPKSKDRRTRLAQALETMAYYVRNAKPETGLD